MERTRNPGVAVAIAIALVSLSGGVYAAAKINGKTIKNGSITGKKLKPDALTGKQVKESTLGTVPSARTLAGVGPGGFAASADSKRIRFERTVTEDTKQEILRLGTLRLIANCQTSFFDVDASSTAPASYDYTSVRSGTTAYPSPYVWGGLVDSSPTYVTAGLGVNNGEYFREVGTLVFNSNTAKETITVDLALFISRNAPNTYCYLAGTATRASG
jgi:hypothetical protein